MTLFSKLSTEEHSIMRLKSPWVPRLGEGEGPVYQRIAAAIIEDVSTGKIAPGSRLPAQRDLAYDLGVGLGTVTKAYNLLTKRGIGTPEKGRAMFVTSKPVERTLIAMDVNIPPNLLSGKMLSRTLAELSVSVEKQDIGVAEPYQGSYDHRRCLAAWLQRYCESVPPERMILCNGGQHAIWISLSLLKRDDITVISNEIPFSGLMMIVNDLRIDIVGVSSDSGGMRPDELERIVKEEKRKGKRPVLYIAPTAQNPIGISLSNSRITELAKICRRQNVLIIEDDVYTAFSRPNHCTFLNLVPDLTFYVNSLAKILSPWFRLGVLVTPSELYQEAMNCISTHGSKISPIIAEVMQQWVTSGLASEVAMMTHQEGIKRNKMASQAFSNNRNTLIGSGFHMFLPMSLGDSKLVWRLAREQGILLSKPSISLNKDPNQSGVRLCLGPPTIDDLTVALDSVAEIHREVTEKRVP